MKKSLFVFWSTIILISTVLLISCNNEKKDWDNANKACSITEFNRFIEEHPKSEYVKDAKRALNSIMLVDLVDYVIAVYCNNYGGASFGNGQNNPPKLSQEEIERLRPLAGIECDLHFDGITSSWDGYYNEMGYDGYLNGILKGTVKRKDKDEKISYNILIKQGVFGINKEGFVFFSEGTKVTIDSINYNYIEGRLKEIK